MSNKIHSDRTDGDHAYWRGWDDARAEKDYNNPFTPNSSLARAYEQGYDDYSYSSDDDGDPMEESNSDVFNEGYNAYWNPYTYTCPYEPGEEAARWWDGFELAEDEDLAKEGLMTAVEHHHDSSQDGVVAWRTTQLKRKDG